MPTPEQNLPGKGGAVALGDLVDALAVQRGSAPFADELRRAFARLRPTVVAVEWPGGELKGGLASALARLPEITALFWRAPEAGEIRRLVMDPCDPFVEAVRLCEEFAIPWYPVDDADGAAGEPFRHLPDDHAASWLGLGVYTERILASVPPADPPRRVRRLAWRLQMLAERAGPLLFVGTLHTVAALRQLSPAGHEPPPPAHDEPTNWHVERIPAPLLDRVLGEPPFVTWLYENFRSGTGPEDRFPLLEAYDRLLDATTEAYIDLYDELVSPTERRALVQFARNLALARHALRPRLYEVLTAAKGCVNDDFGAVCLEKALDYPPNRDDAPPGPEERPLHRSPDIYVDLGEGREKSAPAYPEPPRESVFFTFRRRPNARQKMLWQFDFARSMFEGMGICSYPPEDDFIERFFRTVRTRAFQQITDNHSTTEEFTSSVLDGLDIRETMRHFHEQRLYVRRERLPPGRVGPVVLLWHDFPRATPNLWRTCLYAENQNESDIAFYARPLGEEMVGPGITRTEYHGILSVYPAMGIPNVWRLLEARRFATCGEILVASGVLLSQERYVAVVAPHPPSMELREFARAHKRALIYLPLGTFGRPLLARVRQCHILAGKHVRNWAADYIAPLR